MAATLRTQPAHRPVRFETLERRQLLAYDLAYSVFPDSTGPQNAGFGTEVAVTDSYLVVGSPLEDFNEVFDGGTVRIYDAGSRALLTTINNPAPESNDRFGSAVAVSGNLVVVGVTNYNSPGIAYIFNATTGSLIFTLNNPSPATGDSFGFDVAIDGTTVVVGAPYSDSTVTDIGEIYTFNALTGALLKTMPYPVATTRSAHFGSSVAISGDTIVAGAPNEFSTLAGASYVFQASTGVYLRPLTNPAPSSADKFGTAVAVSGATAVIGAVGDNGTGAAYVYATDTGALLSTLRAASPAAKDLFGSSVAIRGTKVVVGAVQFDNPFPYTTLLKPGAAYLFDAPSGALLATLNNPEPAPHDYFGGSVGISSDLVLVGAMFDNTGRHESGRAWAYSPATADWQSLYNPTRPAGDQFSAVALSGDLLAVGAVGDDTDAQEMGEVYVFNAYTGALVSTFNKPDPGDFDLLGLRVDISGDYVIAGAPFDDSQASANGRAYVFNGRTGELVTKLLNPSNSNDVFGQDVGISGNLAVVGANQTDDGATDSGIAYVFNAITGALLTTLRNPTPAAGEGFGVRTVIEGNLVAVKLNAKSQNGAGEVYLFNALTGALLATLVDPSPNSNSQTFGTAIAVQGNLIVVGDPGSAAVHVFDVSGTRLRSIVGGAVNDFFGVALALADDRLVIGASGKSTSAAGTGQVFVYNVQTGALSQTIDNPTPDANDGFGTYVAASQNILAIGAMQDDTQNFNQGAAYGFIDSTSLRVNSVSATPTGARFTLNLPAALGDLNLTGNGADVSLIGAVVGAVPGSLIVAPGDTDFTFVATGGVLPPDSYTLTLRGAADGFHTATGEQLSGNGGFPGGNHVTNFQVITPPANAITVSLPHFARGPDQAVNVPATSALGLPFQLSDGAGLTSLNFELAFDAGLLNVTNVTLVGGGTATLNPISTGRVQVALSFATALASGAQTVAFLTAAVPTTAANRYGERGVLDISAIVATNVGGVVPTLDRDAVHVNAYHGDVGRNGQYDSFDVQQASRMAVRLDNGFQQHPLLDPVIIGDFNGNNQIDSFDVQRLSRLALRLPVTDVPDLPSPLPIITDTDRIVVEEPPPKASEVIEPPPAPTGPRSDVDGNGAVDSQDVLWTVYYFNSSLGGAAPSDAELEKLDVNADGQLDPADILLTIIDFNQQTKAEGETRVVFRSSDDGEDSIAGDDSLAYLLAENLIAANKKK